MEGPKPADDIHVGWEHAVGVLIAPHCLCLITQPDTTFTQGELWCKKKCWVLASADILAVTWMKWRFKTLS